MEDRTYIDKKMEIQQKRDELYTRKREIEDVYTEAINTQEDLMFCLIKMMDSDIYLQNNPEVIYCFESLKNKAKSISQDYEEEIRYIRQRYREMEDELDEQELECNRQMYLGDEGEDIQ